MNKIYLTGATSFLGSRLRTFLPADSYTVFSAANHENSHEKINQVDITNFSDTQKSIHLFQPDTVIHTAAYVNLSRDYSVGIKCFDVNTVGTMNLLESLRVCPPKLFIYISSEEVYGDGPIPFNEEQRTNPPSPYAVSKVAGEQMSLWYGKEYSFPVVVLRLGTFYGPLQPENKYFAQIILHALQNEPIPCNSGKKMRDYIYIDDAVDLILKVLTMRISRTINGTGKRPYTLLNVIGSIKRLTNSNSEVKIGEIPDRITERDVWHADISLAKRVCGWEPVVDLEEGLSRMVESFM